LLKTFKLQLFHLACEMAFQAAHRSFFLTIVD